MSENEKNAIMDQIFALREKQANCTPAERAIYEKEIRQLYSKLDKG